MGSHHHSSRIPSSDGRLQEFLNGFEKFYNASKNGAGAAGMLYYGFAVSGNSVFCREGYTSVESVMKHREDIKDILDEPMKVVGEGGVKLNVVGPASEVEKMRAKLEERGAIVWTLDSDAFWM